MKVLVPVKRVVDYNVRVRVKPDASGVVTNQVKMSINPFDEIALEQALQLKQSGQITEVVLVTIGETVCQDVLRHGLAMGADRAILVQTDQCLDSLHVGQILQQIVSRETPQLVIMGKQAIDGDCNQAAQMLAGLLSWPQATFACELSLNQDSVEVQREVDGGLQVLRCDLPAVISSDLRLAQPRYVTLPNIMKAKSKPISNIQLDELNLNLKKHSEVLKVMAPEPRQAGVMVADVQELMTKLRDEAGVLS